MTTIVTRAGKGSSLSWNEMDDNLNNLNNDKLEASDIANMLETDDIGVTVEPYDATILKDADIGVSVQAYDSTTTKNTATQTLTNKTIISSGSNTVEATSGPGGSQLAGFRNKIINGGCQVQQRGSVALTGVAQYGGVDRFQMFVNGTGVGGYFGPVVNANFTSGAAIGTASFVTTGGRPWINHKIEAANSRALNGKTVTVRARVYHSQGSTIPWRIGFNKANAEDNFTTETFLGNATMSVANVPSATYTDVIGRYTFGASDCSNGINVLFNPTTDNNYSSGAFYIGEFQLEEGSIATPFEQRPIGLELALCQRYFHRVPARLLWGGYATSGNTYYVAIPHPVVMRAAPVIENLTSASNSGFGATVAGAYTPYITRLQALALSTANNVFYAEYDATAEL